jgi:hypothetical protein
MRFKTFLSMGVILLCSSILAHAALDLRFTTAISQVPDPASVGGAVTFTVTLISDGAIVNDLKLIGGVDATQIVEKIFAGIADGGTRTQNMSWTATAGTHTVWFELDPDHLKGDSNYGNNRVEKVITLGGGPAGQPDLAPVVTYTPTDFAAGAAVAFTIRVNNNGTAASVASQVKVRQGAVDKHTGNIAAIAVGGHANDTYNWTAVCDAVMTVIVDSSNTNTESNEGNNTWSKTMACGDTGGGGLEICIPCLRLYKFKQFERIPLPDPCLSCPPWHDRFERGDPIDILNGIGDKLGNGIGFEGVKGDWQKFLGNSHGLTPNGALKIIFDRAVLGAKRKIQTEGAAGLFMNGLNNTLGQLNGLAKSQFEIR